MQGFLNIISEYIAFRRRSVLPFLKKGKDGVFFEVHVKPSSGRRDLVINKKGYPVLFLKSEAKGGSANEEGVRFLQKLFGVEVSLIRGHTSRRKVFLLRSIDESEVESVIRAKSGRE